VAVTTYTGYSEASIKKWTGVWETSAIPVDLPTTTPVTLGRIVTSILTAGDLLRIHAWARVTNDAGYIIGVGWYLKGYEYTQAGVVNPYFDVGTMNGENVSPVDMHHMPLHNTTLWEVPEAWNGKRIVVCFRADAHTTAWEPGDTLTVDQGYGQFWIEHLKAA